MATSLSRALPRVTGVPARVGLLLALLCAAIISIPIYPVNLVVVPAVVIALAVALRPLLGLSLLVLSVPAQDALSVHVGGAGLTMTRLALAAALAALVLQLPARRQRIRGSWLELPFLLYLGAILISLRGARDVAAGIDVAYQWSVALLALVYALYVVRDRRAVLTIVSVVALGSFAEALLGVLQSQGGAGPASYIVANGISRAFGTFGMPNSYAGFLEMTGPLLAAVAVWAIAQAARAWRRTPTCGTTGEELVAPHSRPWRITALALWLSLAALITFAGIQMSFSRGAWMGTASAALVMMLVAGKRTALLAALGVALMSLLIASGGMAYAPPAISDRFDQLTTQLSFFDSRDIMITDENYAAVERMAHWQTGIAMFEASPLTGVGAGNFNVRFVEFAVHPAFLISRGHAHNYYIHAAAETGIIGLGTYLLLIGSALLICLRAARRSPTGLGRALGVGAVGVTVAVMVHNIVEDLHVLNLGIQLSLVWALAIIGLWFLPHELAEQTKSASGR